MYNQSRLLTSAELDGLTEEIEINTNTVEADQSSEETTTATVANSSLWIDV